MSAALTATRDVIVDLSELDFADSSLMIDLAVLAQRLRARGRTLSLSSPKPHVRQLIELVGLHRLPSVNVITRAPRRAGATA
jgi:anti-anti-sigma factor